MGVLNIKFNGTNFIINVKTDIIVNDKFIDEKQCRGKRKKDSEQ